MNKKDEFEQKRLFSQLTKCESVMVGLASKLGKGIELTGTEKRRYYRHVGIQKKLVTEIVKRGWMAKYSMIGVG